MKTQIIEATAGVPSAPAEPAARASSGATPGPWSVRPTNTPKETLANFIQALWISGPSGSKIARITDTTLLAQRDRLREALYGVIAMLHPYSDDDLKDASESSDPNIERDAKAVIAARAALRETQDDAPSAGKTHAVTAPTK